MNGLHAQPPARVTTRGALAFRGMGVGIRQVSGISPGKMRVSGADRAHLSL